MLLPFYDLQPNFTKDMQFQLHDTPAWRGHFAAVEEEMKAHKLRCPSKALPYITQ